jgi:membrane associated rhomboid family serine protease
VVDFALAPVSYIILIITVAVSVLGLKAAPRIIERCLLRPYNVVRKGDYAPVITCGFVHADITHLLFNGLTLYFFGPPLEATIGSARFAVLYLVGLVISSLGTVYKHRNNPDYASLGASGAILAVLFAFIVYYPTQMLYLYFAIPIPAVVFAFGYLAYTWRASKRAHGRIHHDAHLDGAITGMVFVLITDSGAWGDAVQKVQQAFG